MNMPNFLVIGAMKAGTTALYHALKQHPQIYMSHIKEPHFFTYEGEQLNYAGPVTDLESYHQLFEEASQGTIKGEVSPSYIYSPKAPERIKNYLPNVKLVAILRNPVERAYSNFLMAVRQGDETLSFTQALEQEQQRIKNNWGLLWHYQSKGFYAEQLQRYFKLFNQEQIRIYLYEDWNNHPTGLLQDMFGFLDVDSAFTPDTDSRHNTSGIPQNNIVKTLVQKTYPLRFIYRKLASEELRSHVKKQVFHKPILSTQLHAQLIDLYREDILELQTLLQRDLSSWLEVE